MLNYNSLNECSNYDEVKSEMDNINSISYKNEDSMSDMGFNNSYELSFSPINLPVSKTFDNTQQIYEMFNLTFEKKEIEKNQKEETKPNQKDTKVKININIKESSNFKKLGRKTIKSNEIGEHNKFSDDNLIRKIIHEILKFLLSFINNEIKDPNLKLKNLSGNVIKESNVNDIRDLLNKSLKDIFSSNISGKFRKIPKDFNKNVIEKLLDEEKLEKGNKYEILFNLTLLDCLKHIRGEDIINELKELGTIDMIVKEFEDEYKAKFKDYVQNFEKIVGEKKERKRKKKI